MRSPLILALVLALAACDRSPQTPAQSAPGGPPSFPYQMRAEPPRGDRHAAGRDGEALYSNMCGYCHLLGGMGTNVITVQQIAAGQAPEMGLLANRTDLDAEYVTMVVRGGKGAMPPQTRVDVTDAELQAIAAYLTRERR